MVILEQFKHKLAPLKKQLENDQWYLNHASLHGKDVVETKTSLVKYILGIIILNPLFLAPGIALLDVIPDWSIYPAEEPFRHAIMLTFYILFVLGSCGVVYAHLFVFVYFSMYIKIEMELLTQYFQDVSSKLFDCQVNGDLRDVHHLLVEGIKIHSKLLRYVLYIFRLHRASLTVLSILSMRIS